MNAKSRFLPLTLLAGLLAAPAALADWEDDRHERPHRHHAHCDHGPKERPAPRDGHGRYELQTVSVWVPGYHEEVWVPEQCRYHPRKNRTRCRGGYYERQWVDGHYERRQQWVWVSAPPPPPPAYHPAPPPPPGRPGVSIRVGMHL